jgi:hypothetical protein
MRKEIARNRQSLCGLSCNSETTDEPKRAGPRVVAEPAFLVVSLALNALLLLLLSLVLGPALHSWGIS